MNNDILLPRIEDSLENLQIKIQKFKQDLDEGIITIEQFNSIKKTILEEF